MTHIGSYYAARQKRFLTMKSNKFYIFRHLTHQELVEKTGLRSCYIHESMNRVETHVH